MIEAKLADDIKAALKSGNPETELNRLGPAYAKACGEAIRRLEKCVDFVRKGKDSAALQEAQFAPPLMDLIETLSFPKAHEWRALMEGAGIPPGPNFDASHLEMVGNLYAKKIDGSDPLYRDLAQAMRTKEDDQALLILRLIRKKNPQDAKAAEQVKRVEKRVRDAALTNLAELAASKSKDFFLDALRGFQSEPWETQPEGPAWNAALAYKAELDKAEQRKRCLSILAEVEKNCAKGEWLKVSGLLSTIRSLIAANGFRFDDDLSPDSQKSYSAVLSEAEAWVKKETAKEKKKREDGVRLTKLKGVIRKIQDKEVGPKRETSDLRDDLAELLSVGRDLQEASQSLEDNDLRAFNRTMDSLKTAIARRQKRRKTVIALACIGAIAVAVPTFLFVASHLKKSDELAQLSKNVKDTKNAEALDAFLKNFEKNHPERKEDAEFVPFFQKGHTKVKDARAFRQRFEDRAKQLESRLKDAAEPSELVALREEREALFADLPQINVAYQKDEEDRVAELTLLWNSKQAAFQASAGDKLKGLLDDVLAYSEKHVAMNQPKDQLAANLATLNEKLVTLEDELRKVVGLKDFGLTQGQRDLAASVRETYEDRKKSLADYEAALAALQLSSSEMEHLTQLEKILAFGVTSDPISQAAKEILLFKTAFDGLPAKVLMPAAPERWDLLKNKAMGIYMPEKLVDAEITTLKQLFDASRIKWMRNYRLSSSGDSRQNMKRGGEGWEFNGEPKSKPKTVWALSPPDAPEIKFKPIGSDGAYEVTQTVDKFVSGRTIVSKTFTSTWRGVDRNLKLTGAASFEGDLFWGGMHFEKQEGDLAPGVVFVFGNPDIPGQSVMLDLFPQFARASDPVLKFLDQLKGEKIHPILKAHVHLHLVEMMKIRPDAWGLTNNPLAPSYVFQEKQVLDKITGGKDLIAEWHHALATGYKPTNELWIQLHNFYNAAAPYSGWKEAKFMESFWTSVRSSGFSYHGYCKIDGLWSKSPSTNQTIWGIGATSGKFHIVKQEEGGFSAKPMTPLLSYNTNPGLILARARRAAEMTSISDPNYTRAKAMLPYPFSTWVER